MKIHVTREYESEEEYRAAELGLTRDAAATVTATETVRAPTTTAAADVQDDAVVVVTAERDADGMGWNPDYHSTPKSFTEDGMWRAKRGKADEAKAARAAFKAQGGVTVMPTMPVAAPAMPVMPAAPVLPPPIDFARLVGKITGMMQRGVVNGDSIAALYGKVGATSGAQFETNESLRAALFTELCALEPEVA